MRCWRCGVWRDVRIGEDGIATDDGFAAVSVLQLIVFQGLSGTGKGTTTAKLRVGTNPLPRDVMLS